MRTLPAKRADSEPSLQVIGPHPMTAKAAIPCVKKRNTQKVISKVEVGRSPIQLYATPDGRFVYVANQGTEANPDDTVSAIDVATNSVTATIRTGSGAHGVAVSSESKDVLLTNMFEATVSGIDVASQTVITNIPVGEGASGITCRP